MLRTAFVSMLLMFWVPSVVSAEPVHLSMLSTFEAESKTAEMQSKPTDEIDVAVACFFDYEQTSGMNKICFYDCMGSSAAITISRVSLCPLSINR